MLSILYYISFMTCGLLVFEIFLECGVTVRSFFRPCGDTVRSCFRPCGDTVHAELRIHKIFLFMRSYGASLFINKSIKCDNDYETDGECLYGKNNTRLTVNKQCNSFIKKIRNNRDVESSNLIYFIITLKLLYTIV